MNVIAMANGKEYANRGLMKALDRLDLDKLLLIDTDNNPRNEFPNVVNKCVEIYNNIAIHSMNYTGKLENDNLTPIDNALLKSFEPYMLIAIKMLERTSEYGIPFETRLEMIFTHLKYWNTVLDRQKINLFLCLDIPHGGYNYIIYALCKIKNITTIFIHNSPVMGYSYVLNCLEDHCPEIRPVYEALLLEYANKNIDEITLEGCFLEEYEKQTGDDKNKTPYYMTDKTIVDNYAAFVESKSSLNSLMTNFQYILPIITHPSDRHNQLMQYAKYKNTKKYYAVWNSLLKPLKMQEEKYIYFPLHLQPESTTTPQGGYFTWQYLAIEMINNILPNDVFIYVKENPKQGITARSLDFPAKLAALSQVKLVHRNVDTYALIQNSIAVSTITGTALWEGIFKGKPGIIFGDFIVEHAPGIFKVKTNDDCKKAISKILSEPSSPSKKDLKLFVKALECTCQFGFICRVPLETKFPFEENVNGIYELFHNGFKKYLDKTTFK